MRKVRNNGGPLGHKCTREGNASPGKIGMRNSGARIYATPKDEKHVHRIREATIVDTVHGGILWPTNWGARRHGAQCP